MRSFLSLAVGLLVGAAGAALFIQSLPPKEGSAEERACKLEVELKRAQNRVAALEGADPAGRRRSGHTLADGVRSIAENIREGKPVTPDDVFQASQPLIRDLSPLFDRVRVKELQRQTDAKAGELARKYSLNPAQRESLNKWLYQNAIDESKRYTDLISQKGAKLEDVMKASANVRVDDHLDNFMQGILNGEALAAYKSDRMLEKVNKVQQEADMKVERLDGIVQLDEAQRGQVFGIMARGAPDYDPVMQLEGLGTGTPVTGKSKQDAIIAILRPEQRQAYEESQEKRRVEAQKEMESIGLTLPADWSTLDHLDF